MLQLPVGDGEDWLAVGILVNLDEALCLAGFGFLDQALNVGRIRLQPLGLQRQDWRITGKAFGLIARACGLPACLQGSVCRGGEGIGKARDVSARESGCGRPASPATYLAASGVKG